MGQKQLMVGLSFFSLLLLWLLFVPSQAQILPGALEPLLKWSHRVWGFSPSPVLQG